MPNKDVNDKLFYLLSPMNNQVIGKLRIEQFLYLKVSLILDILNQGSLNIYIYIYGYSQLNLINWTSLSSVRCIIQFKPNDYSHSHYFPVFFLKKSFGGDTIKGFDLFFVLVGLVGLYLYLYYIYYIQAHTQNRCIRILHRNKYQSLQ